MRYRTSLFLGCLLALALLLAACGPTGSQSWAGLAADDRLAYIANGEQVHAIDVATGRIQWTFEDRSKAGTFVSEPGLSDDVVVVGSEGPSGSHSGVLYGLDLAAGTQRWCLAFDEKGAQRAGCPLAQEGTRSGLLGLSAAVDNRVVGGITLVDGIAYVGLASGAVYAVDAESGRDLWRFAADGDVWGAPLVGDGRVYVVSLDHHVYALDQSTGSLVWSKDMGGALAGTPALYNGVLYAGTFGNRLYALDAGSGDIRWEFTATNWVWSGPAVVDDMLYFTDVSGMVYAVHADSGRQEWAVKPGGQVRARPAVTEDSVYIGDRGGNLYALDRANGSQRWVQTLKGDLLVAPLLAGDLVLVSPFNGDNLLQAYTTTGELRWAFAPSK